MGLEGGKVGKVIEFGALAGLTLGRFDVSRDSIKLTTSQHGVSRTFLMNHSQDCCESVVVESISGDPSKALGEVIIDATEHTNRDNPKPGSDQSHTWTYYTIRTQSETIVIRWYGESNGYYSESVDFTEEEAK